MAEVGQAWVSILPAAKGFGSKLNSQIGGEVDASGKKMGSRFGGAMKAGLLSGGVAVGAFVKSSIGSASDAQQSLGATETVFGEFAKSVTANSKGAAQAFGLSANEYRESANLIGSLFKNQGVATDELAGKTDKMVGLGADLAATFGGTTSDAVGALGAAFKGEFDSLERYGVSLKESTVSALLAKRGQDDLTGSQLAAAKQAAVSSLIMQQSKDSLGAFGRESNTLAGQQQRLGAQFENIKATVGTGLLPVLTQFAGFVNSSLLPGLSSAGRFVNNNRTAFGALAGALTAVVVVTKVHAGVMKAHAAITATWTALTKGAAVAQRVLNAVMKANPIGLVITALTALGAGLVLAYKKSETFRKIVDGAFSAVKAVASSVARFVTSTVPAAFASAAASVGKSWKSVKDGASDALNFIKGIPGKVTAVFSGAATLLYNAGSQLMSGLASGIRNKITDAINEVKAGLSKIKDLLPGSPIKAGPLKPWNGGTPGVLLMDMLAKGITKGGKKAEEAMRKQLDRLKDRASGLKDQFVSLSETVAGAFNKDVFGGTLEDMFSGLTGNNGTLTQLLGAFQTLKDSGASKGFLTSLFQSGNSEVALGLAAAGAPAVQQASALFDDNAVLATQLGNTVAGNEFGPQMLAVRDEIRALRKDLNKNALESAARTGYVLGTVINDTAARGIRDRKTGARRR